MIKSLLLSLTVTAVFACEVDYRIWIPRSKTAEPLYRFEKGDKAGYINRNGRIVVPPMLEAYGNYGSEFHDGLLEIAVSDGVYVNRAGHTVLNPGLYRGWDFSEGLAAAMTKDQNVWGYIDTKGKFAISPRFETYPNGYVHPFAEGFALIEVKGKFGFIDHTGEFTIKPQFLQADSFSDGIARVVVDGPCVYVPDGPCASIRTLGGGDPAPRASCKFTYVDRSGAVITNDRYDEARDFSEGLAPVKIGALWGFIDKQGRVVVAPRFEDAQPFSSGLSTIRKGKLYGFADKSGSIRIAPQFRYAEDFSEGLAVVGDGSERYWYIDTNGRRAFREQFALASPFFKGLAHVQLPTPDGEAEKFTYIDKTGKRVFTYVRSVMTRLACRRLAQFIPA